MSDTRFQSVEIAENYAVIAGFMQGLHENEHLLNNKTAFWPEIAESYMRHVITMQEECDGICLVAFVDDVPAGFIFGYMEEPDDSRIEIYTGKELYVSDGYVSPQYRRMGLYRQLNDSLEALFINRGVKRIQRFTLENNTKMRNFLESQGYRVSRVLYEKWV